ncbi:hypothetical protein [Methylobacterium sp. GC_Met_2]|uniref:hypothetical protein n=1 Tax=Methylobacterium sp. GC_Met_2 TaxID=2937376 RepID=UPI00226B5C39|nr:hypothetical protein [Methylobacterium sp. GC_Met_2]
MTDPVDMGCKGFNVVTLADVAGNRHVVIIFERADGEPSLLLSLDADTAIAAAGDLINSAMTARGMEPPATAQ